MGIISYLAATPYPQKKHFCSKCRESTNSGSGTGWKAMPSQQCLPKEAGESQEPMNSTNHPSQAGLLSSRTCLEPSALFMSINNNLGLIKGEKWQRGTSQMSASPMCYVSSEMEFCSLSTSFCFIFNRYLQAPLCLGSL